MTDEVPVALRGDIAEIVADSWRKILQVREVGDDDDFFELGGNSIIVTRIVSYLRRELDIVVDMVQLFDTPIFGEFRQAVEAQLVAAGGGPTSPETTHRSDQTDRHVERQGP